MPDVNRGNRPLSPFMIGQYYRPQMTSISSIMVRITGIATLGAAVLVVAWLLAAAGSEAAFAVVDGLLRRLQLRQVVELQLEDQREVLE